MSEELLKCDFRIDGYDGPKNFWRCNRCGQTITVLGDREPPAKNCSAPEGTVAKPRMKDILLSAIDKIEKNYKDVYLIWFGTKGHYFASWSRNSGFELRPNAAKDFEALRTIVHNQRVYKIPYSVGFDKDKFEDSEYITAVSE